MRSNKALLAGITTGLALCCSPAVLAQANVDLNTWSKKGPSGNGNWTVAADGSSVFQSINGNPTYFVSPNNFFNTTIEGRFGVETTADDDYIGFVFGYNEPGDNSTDASFFLFDWKQFNQSGTELGFRLSRVNGTNTPPFSNAENDNLPNYDVLAINTGTGTGSGTLGWADNTVYDFDLLFGDDRIKIDISGGTGEFASGLTIFDLTPSDVGFTAFETGQFGFYNYSQQSVRYESFTRTDDPVLATTPGDGGTLDFGNVRVSDTTTESVEVVNAGGPGSTLNGTAPTPIDPAFSLATVPDSFLLGESDSTSFDYSFTPNARGVASELVNISSDDPDDTDGHDITLTGRGVGPVYDAANSLDFGSVDANAVQSLFITLSNITTDGDLGGLTDLTLNDITINGDDAVLFSVVGFTLGETISAGADYLLEIQYTGDGTLDLKDAFLLIETDEGALLAGDGSDYQVDLSANAVPEPASLMLLGLGCLAMSRRRRRD